MRSWLNILRPFCLTLPLLLFALRATAMDGSVVVSFSPLDRNEEIHDIVELPDQSILVGSEIGLRRYAADGHFFAQVLKFYRVNHLLRIGTNQVLVAFEGSPTNHLTLVDPNGVADPTINADGQVNAIVRQSDGKILVAGAFVVINGKVRPYLARLNPDLSLDDSFQTPPILGNGVPIFKIALLEDGSIIVSGGFTYIGQTKRFLIARFRSNGDLDTTYDPVSRLDLSRFDGAPGNSPYIDLIGSYRNELYVRNYFGPPTTNNYYATRVDQTGTIFTGVITNYAISNIRIAPDGKLLLAGSFGNVYHSDFYETFIRLFPDETYDSSFFFKDIPTATIGLIPSAIIVTEGGSLYIASAGDYRFLYKLDVQKPKLTINAYSLEKGIFSISVETATASFMQIEDTSDLIHWTPLVTNQIAPPSTNLPVPVSGTWRFLRARTN